MNTNYLYPSQVRLLFDLLSVNLLALPDLALELSHLVDGRLRAEYPPLAEPLACEHLLPVLCRPLSRFPQLSQLAQLQDRVRLIQLLNLCCLHLARLH